MREDWGKKIFRKLQKWGITAGSAGAPGKKEIFEAAE